MDQASKKAVLDITEAKDMQLITLLSQTPDIVLKVPGFAAHKELLELIRGLSDPAARPLFISGKGFAYHWRIQGGGLVQFNLQKGTLELTSPSGYFFKFLSFDADMKVIRIFGDDETQYLTIQYNRAGEIMRAPPPPSES